MNMSTNAERS